MGEFHSDDHCVYYCGRNPSEEMSSHHGQQKSPKCSTWMQSQKRQNDLCSFPRQSIQITVIQVYAPTGNAEEAEVERFYEDLQDLLELTPKKDILFILGDWNAKVRSQETPGVTGKFGCEMRNKAGKRLTVLPRMCTGRSKHPLLTTKEKTLHMDITRWLTPKSDYSILCSQDGEALYSQQKQDWELTAAQIMNSLLPNSD